MPGKIQTKQAATASIVGLVFGLLWTPAVVSGHGQVHEFIAALSRQIATETNNAQLYLERGELFRSDQDWKAAEMDYDRAQRLNPGLDRVNFCRARLLADSGQPKRARAKLDDYLGRHPEDGRAYIERARVLTQLSENQSAVVDYSRGLDQLREPEVEFYLERARLQIEAREIANALHGLDEGIRKLGPLPALESLALDLELSRTNYDAALKRVEVIIDNAPRKETWLVKRAEIQTLAGMTKEAKLSFEAALKAIGLLPRRLQENPPMISLRARVVEGLKKLTESPPDTSAPHP